MGGLGKPTKFDFQYVPRLGKLTEPGVRHDIATSVANHHHLKSAAAPERPVKAELLFAVVAVAVVVVVVVGVVGLLTVAACSSGVIGGAHWAVSPRAWLPSAVAEPQVLQRLG